MKNQGLQEAVLGELEEDTWRTCSEVFRSIVATQMFETNGQCVHKHLTRLQRKGLVESQGSGLTRQWKLANLE